MEFDEIKDCCLLCVHWKAHKPETAGEKLFWLCKKDIVETVAYDDIPGIVQMASPFRCVHYARKDNICGCGDFDKEFCSMCKVCIDCCECHWEK